MLNSLQRLLMVLNWNKKLIFYFQYMKFTFSYLFLNYIEFDQVCISLTITNYYIIIKKCLISEWQLFWENVLLRYNYAIFCTSHMGQRNKNTSRRWDIHYFIQVTYFQISNEIFSGISYHISHEFLSNNHR